MLNKRTANKLIPDVLAKTIKKSNIKKIETGQLVVKDGALWDLQVRNDGYDANGKPTVK
jgi:hypothetical protein